MAIDVHHRWGERGMWGDRVPWVSPTANDLRPDGAGVGILRCWMREADYG